MKQSINHLLGKIKRFVDYEVFIILLLILTNLTSFGLGRLSKIEENRNPLQIQNSAMVSESLSVNNSKVYVASKSGSKYHLLWCSGAQRISEKNKIFFNTKEEAESQGYQPAKNCKGI